MFTKILIPIQKQMADQFVFEHALGLAKQMQAGIMLIHVFSSEDKSQPAMPTPVMYNYPVVTDTLMEGYRSRWEDAENHGLEMLKALADKATTEGITVEFTQNIGSRGNVICKMAENWEADLIVIRQLDRSKLDELFLGSVSNYVVHHAPCPVLTIPEQVQGTIPSSENRSVSLDKTPLQVLAKIQ